MDVILTLLTPSSKVGELDAHGEVIDQAHQPPVDSPDPTYQDGDIGRSELLVGPPVPLPTLDLSLFESDFPPTTTPTEKGPTPTPGAAEPPSLLPSPPPPPIAPIAPIAPNVAFDDDGNLMPGIVDPNSSLEEQQDQLAEHLLHQGLSVDAAQQIAQAEYVKLRGFEDAFISAQASPQLIASAEWTPDVRTARDVIESVESRIAAGGIVGGEISNAIDDVYDAYLRLTSVTDAADTKPTIDQEAAARRLISLMMDLGELARDQHVELTDKQARLVDLARTIQIQGGLPAIYGAAATGGILALRQSPRLAAYEAWVAKPYLRSPVSLIGHSDGGPGVWRYTPSRSSGQDYQEQITNVPRNIEYNVNGRDFDGFDAARNTLLDSKHWDNYPPTTAGDWWKPNVTKEARGQVNDTLGTGLRIEWQVSSEQAAQQLRELFRGDSIIRGKIGVVVIPKK